jgi:hypothetical protein
MSAPTTLTEAIKSPSAKPALPKPHPRTTRILKWVRRAHMYTGLFMAPWVLMYGLSGFVFNHVGWFGGNQRAHFGGGEYAAAGLDDAVSRERWAAAIVDELNSKLGEGAARLALVGDVAPEFNGFATLPATDRSSGAAATLFVDFDDRGGFVQKRTGAPAAVPTDVPRAVTPVLDAKAVENLTAQFSGLALKADPAISGYAFGAPVIPDMMFRCNLRTGAVTMRPARSMEPAVFLMRLHMAHHYPKTFGWWMLWAVIVDFAALLLCFWAVTGIVMWIQMKNVRYSGAFMVVLALLATATVGVAMHAIITRFQT